MVESECVAKITFPLSRNSTEDFCWSKSRIEERKGSVCERGEKGCGWVESTHTRERERERERCRRRRPPLSRKMEGESRCRRRRSPEGGRETGGRGALHSTTRAWQPQKE